MCTDRRGFILPTTLMVMTLLTVMLTAAFILISAESRTTDNSLTMGRAHALAQAGLQKYLTLNRGIGPGTNMDSVRLTFSAGYADVIGSRLVAPNDNGVALWLVRSTGVLTGSTLTGLTTARRSVAQLASFNPGVLAAARRPSSPRAPDRHLVGTSALRIPSPVATSAESRTRATSPSRAACSPA